MAKSILQKEKECIVCKTTLNLHKHHIFFGNSNRKKAEKWGCWCYLCAPHHNMSKHGVHFNKVLDTRLKQFAQRKFEELHSHEEFVQIFRKNYL